MRYLVILILILPIANANLIINEIFPDPIENEKQNEFIELYNPTDSQITLTGYSIKDEKEDDFLEETTIPSNSYLLITIKDSFVYETFSVPESTIKTTVKDTNLGNGLNNQKDTISLLLNNETISEFKYNKTKKNLSWSLYNNEWILTAPTPGYENLDSPKKESKKKKTEEPKEEVKEEIKATVNITENPFKETKEIIEELEEETIENATENYLKPTESNYTQEVYISKDEKARRSGIFFFSFVLLLVTLVLMKEQWNNRQK